MMPHGNPPTQFVTLANPQTAQPKKLKRVLMQLCKQLAHREPQDIACGTGEAAFRSLQVSKKHLFSGVSPPAMIDLPPA